MSLTTWQKQTLQLNDIKRSRKRPIIKSKVDRKYKQKAQWIRILKSYKDKKTVFKRPFFVDDKLHGDFDCLINKTLPGKDRYIIMVLPDGQIKKTNKLYSEFQKEIEQNPNRYPSYFGGYGYFPSEDFFGMFESQKQSMVTQPDFRGATGGDYNPFQTKGGTPIGLIGGTGGTGSIGSTITQALASDKNRQNLTEAMVQSERQKVCNMPAQQAQDYLLHNSPPPLPEYTAQGKKQYQLQELSAVNDPSSFGAKLGNQQGSGSNKHFTNLVSDWNNFLGSIL